MAGLIGKKIGMTSVFSAEGKNIPCTVLEVGPCVVTQVKTKQIDGYDALQLGFDDKKEKNTIMPEAGHFKKAKTPAKKRVFEFQNFNREYKVGDVVTLDIFKDIPWVDVTGFTKGKGFQGVVKRWNFRGVGDATHGQQDRLRAPGSIGASSDPSRVFKGMRMAGRQGNYKQKVLNLKVLDFVEDKNLIIVKGSVPGSKGSYILIQK
ncbi:MAG: 50S ribosomal protein L3 [Bacteroidota bacterium]|nr:50S ribosomal protein L3 [Bacteroidota bacterium]